MKITAHFDSPDRADFAAGALKKSLSPLTKIETEYSLEIAEFIRNNLDEKIAV